MDKNGYKEKKQQRGMEDDDEDESPPPNTHTHSFLLQWKQDSFMQLWKWYKCRQVFVVKGKRVFFQFFFFFLLYPPPLFFSVRDESTGCRNLFIWIYIVHQEYVISNPVCSSSAYETCWFRSDRHPNTNIMYPYSSFYPKSR